MKFLHLFLIIIFLLFIPIRSYSSLSNNCSEEMTTLLKQNPSSVVIQVKGLVCSSCAIGIRIKLSKLNGVDISKFSRGIKLDSSNQYVILAVNEEINFDEIFKSIQKAGYDPMHLCFLKNDKIEKLSFNS